MADAHTIRVFGDLQRQRVRQLAERIPDGWTVTFNPQRRSSDQNAKLWAMLSDVARAKPQGRDLSTDVWKALFMASCGHQVRFEPTLDGQGVVPLGFRSSRLTKAEFSDLIEAIYAYGSDHGVLWSEPMEKAA